MEYQRDVITFLNNGLSTEFNTYSEVMKAVNAAANRKAGESSLDQLLTQLF